MNTQNEKVKQAKEDLLKLKAYNDEALQKAWEKGVGAGFDRGVSVSSEVNIQYEDKIATLKKLLKSVSGHLLMHDSTEQGKMLRELINQKTKENG